MDRQGIRITRRMSWPHLRSMVGQHVRARSPVMVFGSGDQARRLIQRLAAAFPGFNVRFEPAESSPKLERDQWQALWRPPSDA
jgi:hypothetical protein